jgi:hypothetical protein
MRLGAVRGLGPIEKKPGAVFELQSVGVWPRAMATRPSWHGLQWLWLPADQVANFFSGLESFAWMFAQSCRGSNLVKLRGCMDLYPDLIKCVSADINNFCWFLLLFRVSTLLMVRQSAPFPTLIIKCVKNRDSSDFAFSQHYEFLDVGRVHW